VSQQVNWACTASTAAAAAGGGVLLLALHLKLKGLLDPAPNMLLVLY
jgi:hypothetical protein